MYRLLYLAPQPRDADAIDNRKDVENLGYRLSQLNIPTVLEVHEKANPRFVDVPFWLDTLAPQLVHFSGHGTLLSKLLFVDNKGNRHDVPPDAVAGLFAAQAAHAPVKGVILNTCYALKVAEQLVQSVDFVVSTATEIQDESAIRFAETFYPFLAKGSTLQAAFDRGHTQVLANRRGTQEPPRLLFRSGVDPQTYTLSATGGPQPPLTFVHHLCTCPEDERLAQELFTLLRAQRLPFFDVSQIRGGQRRSEVIAEALSRAARVVVLVSSDAQADPGWTALLERILARVGAGQARLFPIRLRPSLPTPELNEFEHFPSSTRAVSQSRPREELWVKFVSMMCELGDKQA